MLKNVVRRPPTRCVRDDGWRLPDRLWAKMERLLPARPEHPLGCHNPRVPDRAAMDAIFFVLRTGCQWNARRETTICSSSSAHRRFQEWVTAGVFAAFWRQGLLAYDAVQGIDWPGWRWTGRWARRRWDERKPAQILRTGASVGSSARSSPMAAVSPSGR